MSAKAQPHDDPGLRDEKRRDGWWLLLIVYSAILLRGYLPFGNVFAGERLVFQGNDAWYHVRLTENLVHNFPRPLAFDPYAAFPGGQTVEIAPFFDLLVACVAWTLGLGAPSQRLVEMTAAWAPPVLGALTAIPVYLFGRRAFERRVGLLAAGLLVVQPGQFLLRSLLGFSDHHVAETLLSTLAAWLLLRALDAAHAAEGAPARARIAGRAALAGVALGAYLLSWGGGAMLVAVFLGALAVLQVLDHLAGRPPAGLGWVSAPAAAAALAVLAPWWAVLPRAEIHATALAAFAATPAILDLLARLAARAGAPRLVFPLGLAVLAAAGVGALRVAAPGLAAAIFGQLARFAPSPTAATVGEAAPLLVGGTVPWAVVWGQYRLAFALGLVGLLVLVVRMARQGARPGTTLLLVWSLAIYAATLSQNRFGYYLDVNLALLFGLLCWTVLGPRRRPPLPRALAATAIALAAFLPPVAPTFELARAQIGPHRGWLDALEWMRENTPEPFGDPAAYFAPYRPPAAGAAYAYPPTAYGVMSWWDYGYWITRVGRRIPTANPTQRGAEDAARFYTAVDEDDAVRILDELGARYAVVNFDLGLWPDPRSGRGYGLLGVLAVWAGEDAGRFWDSIWEPGPDGRRHETIVFYPDFYRTMAMRLSLAGDEGIFATDATWAIAFEEEDRGDGTRIKVGLAAQQFPSYEAASAFLAARPAGERWRIVGRDPVYPCVSLPPVRHLRQVYPAAGPAAGPQPPVRIFERRSE